MFLVRMMIMGIVSLVISISAPNIQRHLMIRTIGSKTVMLRDLNQTSGGTGFHVELPSGRIVIMTNRHICSLADPFGNLLATADGKDHKVSVLKVSEKHDLCLVTPVEGIDGIEIAESLQPGTRVHILGFGALLPLKYTPGYYVAENVAQVCNNHPILCILEPQKYIITYETSFFSAISMGGNSGSSIVDDYGNLVSVLFAGGDKDLTFGVPLSYIKEFVAGE